MTTNIKATNMELTLAISNYVNKKLKAIEKIVTKGEDVNVYVEVGKTTNHHKQGDYFKAEFDIEIDGEKFFTTSEKSDLYKAIDEAKDQLVDKIVNNKKRKITLFKRGAISVKKMIKGVSRRNPFTSKY
ncbi:TPA: ribosome-associated translation inhibitor RaiA [Candidatus Nomurabacteria bacterium]|nr:ribosome-associated translation inhibitor RaiA [Candidatus Nomurabacteria bacterium]HAX65512.1 ribosome-associated translation inhibitor RaiA [Candidatus Nomurabacteria bacterium]HCU01393.1 ribosome-associated translation inhibitor RaiA [Candidatus Nomurabacteria bacterium]